MSYDDAASSGTEAIVVDNVSKVFRISTTPVTSLKERLLGMGRSHYKEFPALTDVEFTISQGETVGILGHNGSGKSTLLKCIAGILTPTSGQVLARGRLASLLELGAGFHPDLTGRENVFINAAFLGMPRREIASRFDEIVDFAGLEQFIDEPVKHYSSGMYVRLAFAVAVNLDPDVLIVDEVLAVGDEVFQLKCMSRIKQFQDEGRTIVLVTHAPETVRQVCDRAIVLDHGNLVIDDEPGKAIRVFREYIHGTSQTAVDTKALVDSPLAVGDVQIHHDQESVRRHVHVGESVWIDIDITTTRRVNDAVLDLEVTDNEGRVLYHVDTDSLDARIAPIDGNGSIRIDIGRIGLLDGKFPINLKLIERSTGRMLDWKERAASFEVLNTTRADGTVAFDVTVRS
ncbi:MAG: ABC transporter ATP-binding protein [Ilumatobacter sp.]|nr:ABC transporter ATP-binding protein [Ilumatobacter sp.]MDG1786655.1 ABC transporter ATP-binding protein [Ilumatobacter sp.]